MPNVEISQRGRAEDVVKDLYFLRQTTNKNVLAFGCPYLPGSLRGVIEEDDDDSDIENKYANVARNFKQRDGSGKFDDSFVCEGAYIDHLKTMNLMKEEAENGKGKNRIRIIITLLVAPDDCRFSFSLFPDSDHEDGTIRPRLNGFTKEGQPVMKITWIVPTTKFKKLKQKSQKKEKVQDAMELLRMMSINDEIGS
mmetsp:Transcript_27697/g.76211  ORF Transcript_27697/g.76211 Transcript_27697/m.76211 type:complete len:196 (-) Transcript_27697:87-674(-)